MRARGAAIAGLVAAAAMVWLLRGRSEGPRGAEVAGESPAAAQAPEGVGGAGGLAAAPASVATPMPAGAAPASAGESPLPAAAGDFRGIVVDERGRPMADVPVAVDPGKGPGPSATRSGPDGRFGFSAPTVEYLEVRARVAGRALRGMTATLEREKETRLVLVPACPLRVRVVDDATGVPVEGAAVRVVTGHFVDAVFTNDLESPFAEEHATDRDGRAALECEGGICNVLVVPVAHAPRQVAHVNVPAEGRDLAVRVGRGGLVEGRVVGPAGKPVAAARVRLDVPALYRRDAATGADGRFRFEGVGRTERLWQGDDGESDLLSVRADGFAPASARVDVPPPGGATSMEVALRPGRRVSGVVRTAEGPPAAGARIGLDWTSGTEDAEADPTRTRADGEGRFELRDQAPGPLELWVDDAGNRTHARVQIDVPESADPAPVTIVLPSRAGRTTVRVVDAGGAAVAGAQVTVRALGPVLDLVTSGVTGADGALALSGLPTDAANVTIVPVGSVAYAQQVGGAHLAGGEVVFRLNAGELAGRARRADGSPARVRLALDRHAEGIHTQGDAVATDGDGRFRFRGLPSGRLELRLDSEGDVLIQTFPWVHAGRMDVEVWVARAEEASRFRAEAILVDAATDQPVSIEGFSASFAPAAGTEGPRLQMHASTGGTTELGRFVSFRPLTPGVYDVVFRASGWRSVPIAGYRIPRDGPVPVLRVDRGVRVEGRVLSGDGKPLADVFVGIGPAETPSGAKTGPDGAFTVTGLEPGEQPAKASGRFVLEETRTVRAPAVGDDRIEWRLRPAGALEVEFADYESRVVGERVVATPIAGGSALREEDDEAPLQVGTRHAAVWGGVVPGRWRIEARQGTTTFPAQEVDVKPGEVTTVRFPIR